MFDEIVRRVHSVERIGEVKRLRSNFVNGIKHLPVRLNRASHTRPPESMKVADASEKAKASRQAMPEVRR